ncbi:hypothetical protein AB9E14_23830 [Rhizobium leguminosarum]|uniref:hypothetical protein n=1 Tax=Rhizobium leguminosarum TaxID=384 RepID=UPI003F99B514
MAALSFAQLQQLCSSPALDGQQLRSLYDTIFTPRFIRVPDTTLTLTDDHRGAWILLTNASAVTVTLPALSAGFLATITPLGAGGATLSGTHIGGSTIAQNGAATVATLDDASWFVTGAA